MCGDTSFKQRVVAFYGDGARGYEEVGSHFDLDHSTVRKLVAMDALTQARHALTRRKPPKL